MSDIPGKYKPKLFEPHSWDNIEQHYVSLVANCWQHEPFLALVRHVRSTGLSERLYAVTSLDRLIIGIYAPLEWERETLLITYDQQKKKWQFKYYPKPFEQVEFEREYDEDKGIEKFDSFIQLIKW